MYDTKHRSLFDHQFRGPRLFIRRVNIGDRLDFCIGVVQVFKHPSEWAFSEYNERQEPWQRYVLIDDARLMNPVGISPMIS